MKVLITGCSSEDYWYKDKIGEIFEVEQDAIFQENYVLTEEVSGFLKQDCHVIQSVGAVLTEWEKSEGELEFWSPVSKRWAPVDTQEDTISFTDILRIKPVEQPQYRPYTFEEANEVFTRQAWVFDKQTEELIAVFRIREDGVFLASYPKTEYDILLSNFNHLDGSPCGVKIN